MTHLSTDARKITTTGDALDFYNTVRRLLDISDRISNDQIREKIVQYYFEHKEINPYGWNDDAKRRTLAILYDVIICLACVRLDGSEVMIEFYGDEASLGKKIIYMLYDETTLKYYPLYVANIIEPTERITICERLKKDLPDCIRDKLGYNFGTFEWNNAEILMRNNEGYKTETIPDSTLMMSSMKSEQIGIDDLPMSPPNNKRLLTSLSNEDDGSNKRLKVTSDSIDAMTTTQDPTQAHDIPVESTTNNAQINPQLDHPMTLNDEHHENDDCPQQCNDDELAYNSELPIPNFSS